MYGLLVGLITRRSQVQILPPPPKVLVRGPRFVVALFGVLRSHSNLTAPLPELDTHGFVWRWPQFCGSPRDLRVMIDLGDAIPNAALFAAVAEIAGELGWGTRVGGERRTPRERAVSRAFHGSLSVLEICGIIVEHGDWRNRQFALTDAGTTTTMLAAIRASAAGPREDPW